MAGALLDLGKETHSMHHSIKKLARGKPIHKTVWGNVLTSSAPVAPVSILVTSDRPATGRVWNILQCNVYGADPHTTVTGSIVDVYCSSVPDSQTPPLVDVLQGNFTVPSTVNYSRQVQWCASGESIYGLIFTPVASQEYNLILDVAEYVIADVEAMGI